MISPATDQIAGEPLDGFVEQYRTELERLRGLGTAESPATGAGLVESLRGPGWPPVTSEAVQEQG